MITYLLAFFTLCVQGIEKNNTLSPNTTVEAPHICSLAADVPFNETHILVSPLAPRQTPSMTWQLVANKTDLLPYTVWYFEENLSSTSSIFSPHYYFEMLPQNLTRCIIIGIFLIFSSRYCIPCTHMLDSIISNTLITQNEEYFDGLKKIMESPKNNISWYQQYKDLQTLNKFLEAKVKAMHKDACTTKKTLKAKDNAYKAIKVSLKEKDNAYKAIELSLKEKNEQLNKGKSKFNKLQKKYNNLNKMHNKKKKALKALESYESLKITHAQQEKKIKEHEKEIIRQGIAYDNLRILYEEVLEKNNLLENKNKQLIEQHKKKKKRTLTKLKKPIKPIPTSTPIKINNTIDNVLQKILEIQKVDQAKMAEVNKKIEANHKNQLLSNHKTYALRNSNILLQAEINTLHQRLAVQEQKQPSINIVSVPMAPAIPPILGSMPLNIPQVSLPAISNNNVSMPHIPFIKGKQNYK